MRNLPNARSLMILLALPLLEVNCHCPPAGPVAPATPVTIKPRQPQSTDSWCTYDIIKSSGGALKYGDVLCVLCPSPAPSVCPTPSQFSPSDGVVYDVVTHGSPLSPSPLPSPANVCGFCPSSNTYENR